MARKLELVKVKFLGYDPDDLSAALMKAFPESKVSIIYYQNELQGVTVKRVVDGLTTKRVTASPRQTEIVLGGD